MKKQLLILFLAAFTLQACKKSDHMSTVDERSPEVIITDIASKLASADSISNFTNSLKNVKLTEAETKDGLTIFAPLNYKSTKGNSSLSELKRLTTTGKKNQTSPSIPDPLLRDYIVKGVLKLSDLTNGKILTAISGRQLNIFRNANIIKINGIVLNAKEVLSSNNEIVFVIKSGLDAVIEIDSMVIAPSLLTEQSFSFLLQESENDINLFHKKLVVLDGILSHDAELDSLPNIYKNSGAYRDIANFGVNSSNSTVKQTWTDAYKIINKLNYIEVNAPDVLTNKYQKVATVKALRGYIYTQLLSYFGNIVLLPRLSNINYIYTNTNKSGVIYAISNDLDSAIYALPKVQSDQNLLNRNTVIAFQAKMAMLQKDYKRVSQLTDSIKGSSAYQLELNASIFSNTSKEFIWNNSTNLDTNVKTYFYNRPNLPYIRYTEILLMNAEANLMLNNIPAAQASLNSVLQRSAKPPLNINNTTLQQTWFSEMKREGNSFINLIRWNTAQAVLGNKGFNASKNSVLPIPQSELNLLPGLVQNPGY